MIDVLASHPRFTAHANPVLAALPPEMRGSVARDVGEMRGSGPILVADGARDLPAALDTGRPVILIISVSVRSCRRNLTHCSLKEFMSPHLESNQEPLP